MSSSQGYQILASEENPEVQQWLRSATAGGIPAVRPSLATRRSSPGPSALRTAIAGPSDLPIAVPAQRRQHHEVSRDASRPSADTILACLREANVPLSLISSFQAYSTSIESRLQRHVELLAKKTEEAEGFRQQAWRRSDMMRAEPHGGQVFLRHIEQQRAEQRVADTSAGQGLSNEDDQSPGDLGDVAVRSSKSSAETSPQLRSASFPPQNPQRSPTSYMPASPLLRRTILPSPASSHTADTTSSAAAALRYSLAVQTRLLPLLTLLPLTVGNPSAADRAYAIASDCHHRARVSPYSNTPTGEALRARCAFYMGCARLAIGATEQEEGAEKAAVRYFTSALACPEGSIEATKAKVWLNGRDHVAVDRRPSSVLSGIIGAYESIRTVIVGSKMQPRPITRNPTSGIEAERASPISTFAGGERIASFRSWSTGEPRSEGEDHLEVQIPSPSRLNALRNTMDDSPSIGPKSQQQIPDTQAYVSPKRYFVLRGSSAGSSDSVQHSGHSSHTSPRAKSVSFSPTSMQPTPFSPAPLQSMPEHEVVDARPPSRSFSLASIFGSATKKLSLDDGDDDAHVGETSGYAPPTMESSDTGGKQSILDRRRFSAVFASAMSMPLVQDTLSMAEEGRSPSTPSYGEEDGAVKRIRKDV